MIIKVYLTNVSYFIILFHSTYPQFFGNKKILQKKDFVGEAGLEPASLAASDPKSDVSTNFTTSGKELKSGSKGKGFA